MSRTAWIALAVSCLLAVCCLCLTLVAGGTALVFLLRPTAPPTAAPPATLEVVRSPTPARASTPTAIPSPTPAPPATLLPPTPAPSTPASSPFPVQSDTLETLRHAEPPLSDLRALAERLKGVENVPQVVASEAPALEAGALRTFNAANVDTNTRFTVRARLAYVTDHVYFWVEEGVNYNQRRLQGMVDRFENQTYPTNREFFGSEWTPGVDGDPHLYMLFARGLGNSVAGYYSSADEYSHLAHPFSNEAEIFYLNADSVSPGVQFTDGVLAHEFQHMIHWFQDRNEETWMNEGFSEVAGFLNGFGPSEASYAYAQDPDQQLTAWPDGPGESTAHYGESFLFLAYFLDRFGGEVTRAVVQRPENGLESMDLALAEQGITDPVTGAPLTADDIFADWAAALYLNDARLGDGRHAYHTVSPVPTPTVVETVATCPAPSAARNVSQYGVDYIRITCPGTFTLRFSGSQQVRLVPPDPVSGETYLWSNRGDDSDMTLTRAFDFSALQGPISFTYRTWFDIEEDYDYIYLEASTDGGRRWTILHTPSGTDSNPSGNSYGWGYTALSGGAARAAWITETVDLSDYAGKQVLLRFEYVTDAAVNHAGLVLDDLSIPQIGYSEDFESGDGGWEMAGWVRVRNRLPQTFAVQIIEKGDTTRVARLPLDGGQQGEHTFTLGGEVRELLVLVSGTTRFTQEAAVYQYEIVSP